MSNTSEEQLRFDLFHAQIQRLGDAYLRACLAVPVPKELEGHEMLALLAMAVAAAKAVGMENKRIVSIVKTCAKGGVKLTETPPEGARE